MKKRKIALLLATSLLACSLVACGKKEKKEETTATTEFSFEESPYEIVYSDAEVWQTYAATYNRVIIEVKNTGTENMEILDAYYDLEDTEGRLVATNQFAWVYPDIIAPNETGYIYRLDTLENYTGNGDVIAVPRFQAVKSNFKYYDSEISSVNVAVMEDWNIDVKGRIENKSNEPIKTPIIYIVCYDKNDNPVCIVDKSLLEEIQPNEQKTFEFGSYFLTEDICSRIDYYDVFSRILLYD